MRSTRSGVAAMSCARYARGSRLSRDVATPYLPRNRSRCCLVRVRLHMELLVARQPLAALPHLCVALACLLLVLAVGYLAVESTRHAARPPASGAAARPGALARIHSLLGVVILCIQGVVLARKTNTGEALGHSLGSLAIIGVPLVLLPTVAPLHFEQHIAAIRATARVAWFSQVGSARRPQGRDAQSQPTRSCLPTPAPHPQLPSAPPLLCFCAAVHAASVGHPARPAGGSGLARCTLRLRMARREVRRARQARHASKQAAPPSSPRPPLPCCPRRTGRRPGRWAPSRTPSPSCWAPAHWAC